MKLHIGLAGLVCAMSLTVHAAEFDGSRLLICAPVEAKTCAPGEFCDSVTPGEAGAPAFVRIDFNKQVIIGPETTTPIKLMETSEKQILLQGSELGFGWTIALDQESGSMSAILLDREGAFVLFGSCTPL